MIAIVAIPAEDNAVWRYSSEKVPHLTLMVLDDKLENLNHVTDFVQHVTETTLGRFGMDVERRGVLGAKSADVLFFGQHGREKLEQFRSYLLTDADILKAYNNVEQFRQWTPHLTMGFPETPAPEDDREDPGFGWVNFDRIALWTGDYEGVEFRLKEDNALSMSDKGAEFIAHYGVKGMKWGVTRAQLKDAKDVVYKNTYQSSPDAAKAAKYQIRAKIGGVRNLDNRELQAVIRRMALEQQYRDLYGERQYHDEAVSRAKRYSKRGARWVGRLLTDILKDGGSSWIKRPGSDASGQPSSRVRAWTTGQEFGTAIEGPVSRKAIGS